MKDIVRRVIIAIDKRKAERAAQDALEFWIDDLDKDGLPEVKLSAFEVEGDADGASGFRAIRTTYVKYDFARVSIGTNEFFKKFLLSAAKKADLAEDIDDLNVSFGEWMGMVSKAANGIRLRETGLVVGSGDVTFAFGDTELDISFDKKDLDKLEVDVYLALEVSKRRIVARQRLDEGALGVSLRGVSEELWDAEAKDIAAAARMLSGSEIMRFGIGIGRM